MGRGRAKAKQTKVARDLKYRSHETDFGALAKELHGQPDDVGPTDQVGSDGDVEDVDDVGEVQDVEDDDWSGYSATRD